MTERQTVAGAYARIDKHEAVCAERYGDIRDRVRMLTHLFGWGGALAVSLLLSVAAWGLNRVFDAQQAQLQALRQVQIEAARHPNP